MLDWRLRTKKTSVMGNCDAGYLNQSGKASISAQDRTGTCGRATLKKLNNAYLSRSTGMRRKVTQLS